LKRLHIRHVQYLSPNFLGHICLPRRTQSKHRLCNSHSLRFPTLYAFVFLLVAHSPNFEVSMPDLNSLPLSRSPSSHPQPLTSTNSSDTFRPTPQTPSPLSHSPSIAFATSTDTQNAGSPRRRGSPRMERRRSSMLGTWSLNDGPGMSAGTMADPHRQRAPSLGELHQELENEQEAQVVCMAFPLRPCRDHISFAIRKCGSFINNALLLDRIVC